MDSNHPDNDRMTPASRSEETPKPDFRMELDEIKQILASDDEKGEPETPPKENGDFRRELFDWAQALVTSIIFVGFLFIFVARVIGVEGWSMENTLMNTEKVLISNLFYEPTQGDIVVFTKHGLHLNYLDGIDSNSDRPLVKRIIAVGGQKVDIDFERGEVWVDDVLQVEPYIKVPTTSSEGVSFPLIVPEGHVFVMGDNRGDSLDSRSPTVGTIDKRYILGRVLMRLWPISKLGPVS